MAELYMNILPPAQRELWPQLSDVPENFILYGGTAIALQLGHRMSEDFDFFTSRSFKPDELIERLVILSNAEIRQSLKDTLTVSVPAGADTVKVSFFGGLPLNHVRKPMQADNEVRVASILDLLGTKCKVVIDRAQVKDYLDIIAILQQTGLTLTDGIAAAMTIYGKSFVPVTSLKALSYTSDLSTGLTRPELSVLHNAIKDVALDKLPTVAPLGAIGKYP